MIIPNFSHFKFSFEIDELKFQLLQIEESKSAVAAVAEVAAVAAA